MSSGQPRTLHRAGGSTIAYRATPGKSPGVLFCGGYRSDMTGAKATALEEYCRGAGRGYVRFDYGGHGESGGTFEALTFTDWVDDALLMLDTVAEGPQVLVGSSMGGWVALRLAVLRPGRVRGLVGVAAAPDFTEDLMWDLFDERVRAVLREEGVWRGNGPVGDDETVVTMALIESGREHLMLRDEIAIDAPVRLLHGAEDRSVPWETSLRLLGRLRREDATLTLVKGGHHRLSQPENLDLLVRTVDDLLAEVG